MKIRCVQPEEVEIVLKLIHDLAHFAKAPLEVGGNRETLTGDYFFARLKSFLQPCKSRVRDRQNGNSVFELFDFVMLCD